MKRTLLFLITLCVVAACNRGETQYQAIADTLNTSEPLELSRITKAHDMIIDASHLTAEQATHLQELFVKYIFACADIQTSLMEEAYGTALTTNDPQLMEQQLDSLNRAMSQLRQYGIMMYTSEGGITTDVMPIFIAEAFWKYMTPLERTIATLSELEVETPSLNDAAINITYEEIAQRLKMCDDMLARYPNDQLTPQIVACQKYYLAILLAGADNSPVFDWETQMLMPQIQQIIELYITEYPDAVSTPLLQQFMALAAASNFKKSADIDTFIEQYILEQN
ncbi:MAG: hypothetical protein ACI30H_00905 [Paludibacteraceae bacterium]